MKIELICSLTLLLSLLSLAAVSPKAVAQDRRAASRRIAEALKPYVEGHSLAGAVVLVANREGILDETAVGFSDIANAKRMQTNALFWIASQSKPITAAALMMLVDEGKLSLDDPVEKYLPEFHNLWVISEQDANHQLLQRPQHPITVRQILSHTAGMSFSSALEQPTLDLLPLEKAVRSYAMTPLQYQPGTRYQYANAGINTAGRLIEVLSGMDYETFLQKRIFDPLGMKDTTFRPNARQIARLAKSYKPDARKTGLEETTVTQLKYPLNDPSRQPMPAGGLFSTASDVARFCRMLLNGGTLDGRRYLSEKSVNQMTHKQTPEGVAEEYGLGLSTGGGVFGHGGAYSTNMVMDPKRDLILIFMVQHAGFPGNGGESFGVFRKAAEEQYGH